MSFDLEDVKRAIGQVGPVVRVVMAEVKGSAPREAGTAMLVWPGGQSGTIGGGALEFEAARRARAMLNAGQPWEVWTLPLGPSLGQCCGGAVTLLAEVFERAPKPEDFPRAVSLRGGDAPPEHRDVTEVTLSDGWLIEPLAQTRHALWIWGAGHVGRALVDVLTPIRDIGITWLDTSPERFPTQVPHAVTHLPVPDLPRAMALAPKSAHHLILTYSHDHDLALCHAALRHGFATCGLIGSKTKWARFCSRLQAFGHSNAEISRITCPIGERSLGKHPQAIAIGVATRQLAILSATLTGDQRTADLEGHEHDTS